MSAETVEGAVGVGEELVVVVRLESEGSGQSFPPRDVDREWPQFGGTRGVWRRLSLMP